MLIATTGIGDVTVHAIEDGWAVRDPMVMFPGSDPAAWAPGVAGVEGGRLRVSYGCFLLETPDGHILVDSGIGPLEGDGMAGGRLGTALDELRIGPTSIVAVVHTHLHPDHISGDLTPQGDLAFPEAMVHAHPAETAYWSGRPANPMADSVLSVVTPLEAAGRLRPVDHTTPLTSRVSVIETPGHTPGHVSVVVDGGDGTRLVITGDVTHHPAQARHPEWNVAADLDPVRAVETRRRVFAMLADEGWVQASGHYPRPGVGRVGRDGDTFTHRPGVGG